MKKISAVIAAADAAIHAAQAAQSILVPSKIWRVGLEI